MNSDHITFLFDLDSASPRSMPPADDFITLLALPSPNKFDTAPFSPLDIAKLGPFRSPDLVSPVTLFSESEIDVTVNASPTLETRDLSAVNSHPISYELYSPLQERYAEDSDDSSRSATPESMHSVSEPSSLRDFRSPSPTPSSASEYSPRNSRTVTPEASPPHSSKTRRVVVPEGRTVASVGRRSIVTTSSGRSWSKAENRACVKLMRQVCSETKFQGKESRFAEVSRRMLKEYGFSRPNVKNQWNRYLRARCGFEDRGEKKRGGGVVTSALSRKRKRTAVIEDDDEQEEADEDNGLGAADADDEDDVEDDKLNVPGPAPTTTNRTGWRPLGGKSYGGKSVPGYVPSPSRGGKSYTGKSFASKTLPTKPVIKPSPRKTINTKSLSINTNNHNYTGGKTIWPSIEKEAEYVVVSDAEPISPRSPTPSPSTSVSDDQRDDQGKGLSDDSNFGSDDSDSEYISSAPASKKRKIGNGDAAMAAELQRAWGLGLRRRG
ncbi:hypothetical protein MBLNU457_3757t1 [Dothideomycetes sp. NU457]